MTKKKALGLLCKAIARGSVLTLAEANRKGAWIVSTTRMGADIVVEIADDGPIIVTRRWILTVKEG